MRSLFASFAILTISLAAACNGNGGCPLLPTDSEVTVTPTTDCLSLHIEGSEDGESGRCVDGLSVVGTNNCQAPLVLTPPIADADVGPVTFAPGAAVSFEVDTSQGTAADGQVIWSIPATLGNASVTIRVVGQGS
ncbi:Hypothetical protein A7982_01399 [Minicystis rosea]|nr:Hypothetical protein A7982_01399 [Minicystis rosea]